MLILYYIVTIDFLGVYATINFYGLYNFTVHKNIHSLEMFHSHAKIDI
ncbi:MAG: hypothetical protein JWQ28_2757 [Pedobacter sp.]|jgi:hypothetical protein|nr:hypothetical protein [Pedobacter sp.]